MELESPLEVKVNFQEVGIAIRVRSADDRAGIVVYGERETVWWYSVRFAIAQFFHGVGM